MVEEKTMEELKAELALLEKSNLERKVAKERAEAEEAEELKKKEAEDKLRLEIHKEEEEKILKEMGDKSKIESDEETKDDEPVKLTYDTSNQIRNHYSKTVLKDIPDTPGTRAVFVEDKAYLAKAVEKDTWRLKWKDNRKITGRKYEDIVKSISMNDIGGN